MPSDSASGASLRWRASGAKRRAIATVQSDRRVGQSSPARSNACASTRRSNDALWATSTRPSSISASRGSTSSGGGASSTIAWVMPVKRSMPRDSGRSTRTSDS